MNVLRSRLPVKRVNVFVFALALAVCGLLGNANVANAGSIILWSATGADGSWTLVNSAGDGGPGTPGGGQLGLPGNIPVIANGITVDALSLSSVQSAAASFTTTSTVTVNGNGTLYLAFGVTGFTMPAGTVKIKTQVSSLLNPSPDTGTIDAHDASWVTQNGLLPAAGGSEFNSAWQTGTNLGGVPTPSSGIVVNSPQSIIVDSLGTPYTITSELVIVVSGTGGSVNTSTTVTPTPEPTSITLLGIGLVGMAGYGWRRRKAANVEATVA